MRHIAAICLAIVFATAGYTQTKVTLLPTAQEAGAEYVRETIEAGGKPTVPAMLEAQKNAREKEIQAIEAGRESLVDPEERADLRVEIQARREAAEAQAKAQAEKAKEERLRADLLKTYHCDSFVSVGMKEICVNIIMGAPLHTNEDLSVKQLVYPDQYIYINKKDGLVEDIQKSY